MTKKSSFLRQLNLYSFNRFSAGPDQGSYYHEKFLRGMKYLARRMVRQKVNGNRIRSAGNPDEEPNLALYPSCPPPSLASAREGGHAMGHPVHEHAIYTALATMAAAAQTSLGSVPSKKRTAHLSRDKDFDGGSGGVEDMSGNVSSDNNNNDDMDDGQDHDDGDSDASSDDNYVSATKASAPPAATTAGQSRPWRVP
jgi:hypothetical protein